MVTLSLDNADHASMPAEIDVAAIAEDACQAAFKVIAERLASDGYPVTGDFGPGEVYQLDAAFALFVRAMALNNPVIAALNEDDD